MNKKTTSLLKKLVPNSVAMAVARFLNKRQSKDFQGLSPVETFSRIYNENLWGGYANPDDKYDSGSGSHNEAVTIPYVKAVKDFLSTFDKKQNVVDLGCGDFSIGEQLRSACGKYVACDVVGDLIDRNKEKYKDLDVDFRVVDITSDPIPRGDVIFVRQVLQHLTNEQISLFLSQLGDHYKHILVTEHLPYDEAFVPNLDKLNGPDIRLFNNSGVVLTELPFSLSCKNQKILCEVVVDSGRGGVIRTISYSL